MEMTISIGEKHVSIRCEPEDIGGTEAASAQFLNDKVRVALYVLKDMVGAQTLASQKLCEARGLRSVELSAGDYWRFAAAVSPLHAPVENNLEGFIAGYLCTIDGAAFSLNMNVESDYERDCAPTIERLRRVPRNGVAEE